MTDLDASIETVDLPLEDSFAIARGTTETATNVLVEIADGDRVGIGGAAPSWRYGETPESVEAALPDLLDVVADVGDPLALDRSERGMGEVAPEEAAARSAVSIALHDLIGKRLGLPLYRFAGLDPLRVPPSSHTIGLESPDRMAEKAAALVEAGFEVLKVKVGDGRPVERLDAVRGAAPEATIRVDANEAWRPGEAIDVIDAIAAFDVAFVEQPVPAGDPAGLARVHERSPVSIAADESCLVAADVPDVADRADVVVVKLMKCGGVREALRMAAVAHAHDLDAMLGCMVESNASIAAGCHLAPAFEYADLDGSLLLADDPCAGVPMPGGEIDLASSGPGTGARRR